MTLPLVFSEIYLLIVTTILVLWNNADVLLKNSVSLSIIYRTTSCSMTDPNLPIVQNHVAASWWGMWDKALDLGTKGTRLSQCLFSILCPTVFSNGVCPLCESQILSHHNYFERLNTVHMNNKNVLNFSNILEDDRVFGTLHHLFIFRLLSTLFLKIVFCFITMPNLFALYL